MPRATSTTSAFTLGPALLFCPGIRPDRFGKAAARADAVIVDLEDTVVPVDKAEARAVVVAALTGGGAEGDAPVPALDPASTVIRINTVSPQEREADLLALADTPVRHVMVPKAADVELLDEVADTLPEVSLIPQIESPSGVLEAARIARHPGVEALFWGTEDMIAELGGTTSRTPDGAYREVIRHVRNSVLIAAGAAGVPAIDSIHTNFKDIKRLAVEAEDACASGFIAKACIHPQQVEPVRRAYTPMPAEVEWSKSLLAIFRKEAGVDADGAPATDPHDVGAFTFRGEMIDAPVVVQAQRIMARYDATRVRQPGE